jgi:hypothetical protein
LTGSAKAGWAGVDLASSMWLSEKVPPVTRPACAPLPQSSSMFRGDNEELLDHLLFACHEHKSKPMMEGFGRALTPYFAEDQGPVPCGR